MSCFTGSVHVFRERGFAYKKSARSERLTGAGADLLGIGLIGLKMDHREYGGADDG